MNDESFDENTNHRANKPFYGRYNQTIARQPSKGRLIGPDPINGPIY
jgi:hypothetical protein